MIRGFKKIDHRWSLLLLFALVFIPFIGNHLTAIALIAPIISILAMTTEIKVKWPLKLIAILLSFAVIAIGHRGFASINAGADLMAILISMKLLEINEDRDKYTFILMVTILLVSYLLLETSLFLVVYIIGVIIAMFFTILGIVSKSKERIAPFIRLIGISFGVSFILFLIFPRLELSSIMFRPRLDFGKTGFSSTLDPGSISDLVKDETPVFNAMIGEGESIAPRDQYWRGTILGRSKGLSWSSGPGRRTEYQATKDLKNYTVVFNGPYAGHLFTLQNTTRIQSSPKSNALKRLANNWFLISYSRNAPSFTATLSEVEHLPMSQLERKNYTGLPNQVKTKGLMELAARLQAKTTTQSIQNIENYFLNGGFDYTLSPGKYNNLDQFLFERKAGFCEHYAAATATLMRAMNILSRVVTGFQGGIFNPVGGYYIVRNEDAHAWVEYWDGTQWKMFDPVQFVAPSRIERGAYNYFRNLEEVGAIDFTTLINDPNRSLWSKIRFISLMTYYDFNTRFINYDLETQKKFLSQYLSGRQVPKYLFYLSVALFFILYSAIYFGITYFDTRPTKIKRIEKRIKRKLKKEGYRFPKWYSIQKIAEEYKGANKEVLDSVAKLHSVVKYSDGGEEKMVELEKRVLGL